MPLRGCERQARPLPSLAGHTERAAVQNPMVKHGLRVRHRSRDRGGHRHRVDVRGCFLGARCGRASPASSDRGSTSVVGLPRRRDAGQGCRQTQKPREKRHGRVNEFSEFWK